METLLTLDPGLTTGWAVFYRGVVQASGDVPVEGIQEAIWLWKEMEPETVVAEMVAPRGVNKHSQALTLVMSRIRDAFPDAEWVTPGQWKPITGQWPIPVPRSGKKLSAHQRDAIRLGFWKLRRVI